MVVVGTGPYVGDNVMMMWENIPAPHPVEAINFLTDEYSGFWEFSDMPGE